MWQIIGGVLAAVAGTALLLWYRKHNAEEAAKQDELNRLQQVAREAETEKTKVVAEKTAKEMTDEQAADFFNRSKLPPPRK